MNKVKPQRPKTHILESKSKYHFEQSLPESWYTNTPNHDYGIDLSVEIVDSDFVTGLNFSVQLKAKSSDSSKIYASVPIKTSTLNYYSVRFEPVLLFVYIENENEAYFSWINEIDYKESNTQSTIQIKVPKANKLSTINWNDIQGYVQKIFSKKMFLENMPLIDYSTISNLEAQAWRHYYRREHEEAVFLFKKLLENNSKNILFLNTLAMCQYAIHNYNDALSTIHKALDISSQPELLLNKASILAEDGIKNIERGKLLEARRIFEKYLQKDSNNVLYHYNYANTQSALGNYKIAEKHYLECLAINPNKAEVWKNLGQVYFHMKKHVEEIECYDNALKLNPYLPEALMSKGITLTSIYQQHEEALSLMKKSIDYAPDYVKAFFSTFYWFAYAYEKMGDYDQSLNWLDKGLDYRSDDVYLLNFKSILLSRIWRINNKYKEVALTFFEYRYELEKDLKSLYHLFLIREEDKHSDDYLFNQLKDHTPFFKNISFDYFKRFKFADSKLLACVPYLREYAEYRKNIPLSRYELQVQSEYITLEIEFWDLLEFISGSTFGSTYLKLYQNKSLDQVIQNTIQIIGDSMPFLALTLIPKDLSTEDRVSVMATILSGIPTIALREAAAQIGFIGGSIGLENAAKLDDYNLGNKWFGDVLERTLYITNKEMKLFPDE